MSAYFLYKLNGSLSNLKIYEGGIVLPLPPFSHYIKNKAKKGFYIPSTQIEKIYKNLTSEITIKTKTGQLYTLPAEFSKNISVDELNQILSKNKPQA